MQTGSITGIILAGGKSSRFGSDKALFPYKGKRLIEYAIDVLRPFCSEILLSTNNPEKFIFTGLTTIADINPDCGPLGGIHACLLRSQNDDNIVVGCDLPGIQPGLYSALMACKAGFGAVVPVHHGLKEPLASYFNRSAIPVIEKALEQKQYKLFDVFAELNTLYLDVTKMDFYSQKLFVNVNSRKDIHNINLDNL